MKYGEHWNENLELRTVILPIGSTEAHGRHLPFATDSILPEKMAEAAAIKTNVFVLPVLNYGNTQRLSNFKGTISISAQGLVTITKEILESLIKQGVEKIIIFNGHDGNQHSLQVAARDVLERSDKNIKIFVVDGWWNLIDESVLIDLNLTRNFGHSGKEETSVMLHAAPETVDMNKSVNQPFVEETHLTKYYFNDRKIPSEGDSKNASKEIGKKLFDSVVDALVDLIRKF